MRKIIKFFWKRKILLVALLGVFGYGIWSFVISPKGQSQHSFQVERGTLTQELVLTGKIEAREHANLSFQTSGELAWVGVTEGQAVKKGQILANLDSKILYETYEASVADLRAAQTSLESVYDQVEGHTSDESFAQRELRTTTEVRRDKSYRALEIAKKNLSNLYIKSPFPGIISSVTYPFTGIFIPFSQGVIEIVNPQSLYFEVLADQTEVVELQDGMAVRIVLDPFPTEEVGGTISHIGYTPTPNEAGTLYKVKITFTNTGDLSKFRVGMGGDAKLVIAEKTDVLFAPPEFINSDAKGKYVLVSPSKKKVYIETGVEGEEKVEVKGAINEGDILYD